MQALAKANTFTADVASRRILRLALGTTLSMAFSQLVNWPLSFMAAIFTMFLLATPLPAPGLKSGIKFTLALVLPAYLSMLLIPLLLHTRWAGVIMVLLALYGSFYYAARGGSPVMGMFMTMGIALVVTVGSVSPEAMQLLVNSIAMSALAGIFFVMIAHALIPDLPAPQPIAPNAGTSQANAAGSSAASAKRSAFRALMVMLPLVLVFLFSSSSTSYVAMMIKVSSMGQQANADDSRSMGREQLESTLWGGIGAVIGFQMMTLWHSLLLFCLLIAIACLVYGRRIFKGPGMHPRGGMWSYALLTMIILLTPAITSGNAVSGAFYTRLALFVLIAVYGSISVAVFDAFWRGNQN
jgi:hypothetical protein